MRSKNYAKLRRVGLSCGEDLPAAGLEVFGYGAVAGDRDLVVGGGDGAELENCHGVVGWSGNLDGAVHAWGLRKGFGCVCTVGFGN